MKYLTLFIVILTLTARACALDFNPPALIVTPPVGEATRLPNFIMATPTLTAAPATETPAVQQETPTPEKSVLTMDQLRNASLTIMGSDNLLHTINLQDGRFETGTDPSQPGYISVILGDQIAFGDLNADGLEDAAISLIETFGGTGEFVSVAAILNQAGQPLAVASAQIEDRPLLNEIAIRDSEIFVDAVIHGPEDPMCCPSVPSKRSYLLDENTLLLWQFSSTTPNGIERIIQIDTPNSGAEINAPFVISGRVSVSPFENNLVYSVYAGSSQNPLLHAGLIIQADEMGGPGTFELTLDPAEFNVTGVLRIVLSDISAADGSLLALNTLSLNLK